MKKRYFNTTGFCRPDWHYMLNPLRNIESNIYQLIENKQYFILHAPRQSGKTTLLHSLAHQLNADGKYTAIVFSVESAGYKSITEELANRKMIESLIQTSVLFLNNNEEKPPIYNSEKHISLQSYLSDWSANNSKPIVLLLDEIDALYDDILVSVLRQLRNGFQTRPLSFPASIALVGLRDVREYKMKARPDGTSLGSGSPFNIKAKSFTLQNFNNQEVYQLLNQHTQDTGQKFTPEVSTLIHYYTDGQPWLVNAMANHIITRILQNDTSQEITADIVIQAKEDLIKRRDTHLDSLIDKLQEDKVKKIVIAIMQGNVPNFNTFNDDLLYCINLGIVKRDNTGVRFANKIYQEIIPRVLNYGMQETMVPIVEPQWFFTKEDKLNMNALLKEFQQFYRENSESWLERFDYKEAGHQLLLMAFLQRVINGGGQIEREMALGNGRCDMVVKYNNQNSVMELKVKHTNFNFERSKTQLVQYLDKLNEEHGYLIIFESKPSTEIAWENRIKWYDSQHTWNEITKQITIVEM